MIHLDGSEKLNAVLGRLGALVALVFAGTSMSLFCFVVVGAIRKELADQEGRLSGSVYTVAQREDRRKRKRRRRWLLVLALAFLLAAAALLPTIH